jgi:hypothetical protein
MAYRMRTASGLFDFYYIVNAIPMRKPLYWSSKVLSNANVLLLLMEPMALRMRSRPSLWYTMLMVPAS